MTSPRHSSRLAVVLAAVAAVSIGPAATPPSLGAGVAWTSTRTRADAAPPTLADFAVAPAVVDTSRVPQRIAFTAHLKDDSSGVKAAGDGTVSHVQFRSPGGRFVLAQFDAAHRISGSPTDGEYRDLVTLPAGADSGTWKVWQFRLVDQAGNSATIDAAHLAARGFPSSFANTPGSGRSLAVTTGGAGTGTVRSVPVGIACPSVCGTDFAAGSTVRLYAAPSATSVFTGWQGVCSGVAATCSLVMDGHRWAQANFARKLETLAVSTAGSGSVTSSPPGIACPPTCSHGFLVGITVHLTDRPASGSHFLSWALGCSGSTSCAVAMTGPRNVRARFAPDTSPLGQAFTRYVGSRSDRVGVAVYDAHTGTTWTLNPAGEFQTASVVKVQIMGAILHRAQVEGRGLTTFEQQNIVPMIEVSDNNAATNLWNSVGGASGVAAFDHLAGMTATTPNSSWGLTTTTAPDNVRLVRDYAFPSSALADRWRAFGVNLMEHVVDWQRWGVSAGATPGTTVALKNGWLPLSDSAQWRINSIGWIRGNGRDYVIAVLTDHNPSMQYGIGTIEAISHRAWNAFRLP